MHDKKTAVNSINDTQLYSLKMEDTLPVLSSAAIDSQLTPQFIMRKSEHSAQEHLIHADSHSIHPRALLYVDTQRSSDTGEPDMLAGVTTRPLHSESETNMPTEARCTKTSTKEAS